VSSMFLDIPPRYPRREFLHTSETTEFHLDFSTGLITPCGKLFELRSLDYRDDVGREIWFFEKKEDGSRYKAKARTYSPDRAWSPDERVQPDCSLISVEA
jgi:hypothetical protein